MKAFYLTTMMVIMMLLCKHGIQAQEAVAALGGNVTGSGGTISFTVGQVSYAAITSTSGTITHGVQQPYEIFIVTGIEETDGINLEMVIYPNPASDYLILKIRDYMPENHTYQLFDVNSRLLKNGVILDKETVIHTGDLPPAEYYLKVTDNQKEIKTFKIIKN